jgi:hypothetical protein
LISIPDGVTYLGEKAFDRNFSLASIIYCGKITSFPIMPTCPPERKAVIDAKLVEDNAAAGKAAADAKKKATVTCVKGKLTKKVTAVNPKCPAGYKKK